MTNAKCYSHGYSRVYYVCPWYLDLRNHTDDFSISSVRRHTTPVAGRVGLVLENFPFTNAASQWLYVNLVWAEYIPALVGFLQALRFPPTPKNRNPFIFLVHSFWSLVVCIKPACLPEVELPTCALRLSHSGALRTQWIDLSRVSKTANYHYHYYYYLLPRNLELARCFKNVADTWFSF